MPELSERNQTLKDFPIYHVPVADDEVEDSGRRGNTAIFGVIWRHPDGVWEGEVMGGLTFEVARLRWKVEPYWNKEKCLLYIQERARELPQYTFDVVHLGFCYPERRSISDRETPGNKRLSEICEQRTKERR